MVPWPHQTQPQNGISIGLAVFAGLMKLWTWPTDRPTEQPRHSVCSNRPLSLRCGLIMTKRPAGLITSCFVKVMIRQDLFSPWLSPISSVNMLFKTLCSVHIAARQVLMRSKLNRRPIVDNVERFLKSRGMLLFSNGQRVET